MKVIIFILLVIYGFTTSAQVVHLDSIRWISPDLHNSLKFSDGIIDFRFDYGGHKSYKIKKDTLFLIDRYTSSGDDFKEEQVDTVLLLIKNLTIDSVILEPLILKPLKTRNKFLVTKKSYHIKNLKGNIDTMFKFTRLIFIASCSRFCPKHIIEIQANGNYFLRGKEYSEKLEGFFKGQLSTYQLKTLNQLLQSSHLKQMFKWKQISEVQDPMDYYLNIYSNYSKINIRTNDPPLNLIGLLSFLSESHNKLKLVEMGKPFTFNW